MTKPFDDRIETWAAEFPAEPEAGVLSREAREESPGVLAEFLRAACAGGTDPSELAEPEVRSGLTAVAGRLSAGAAAREALPDMVAGFLAMLERQGRVAGGAALGAYARALRKSLPSGATASGPARGTTIRREYSKLGPNDPCPCGSGKKWKKCCRSLFDR